jgi:hypothetical protein
LAAGGVLAPTLFSVLIQSGKPINVFYGDLLGAVLMAGAGVIEIIFGVNAERKSLESIARPLSFVEEEEEREAGMAQAG